MARPSNYPDDIDPLADTFDWEPGSDDTDFNLKVPHGGGTGSERAEPDPPVRPAERRSSAGKPFETDIYTHEGSDRVSISLSFLFRLLGWAFDGVIGITESSRIVYSDRSFYRLTGYRHSDIKGQHVKLLVPHRYRGAHDDYVKAFFDSGRSFSDIGGRSSDSPMSITALTSEGLEIELTAFLFKLNRGHSHRAFALLRRAPEKEEEKPQPKPSSKGGDIIHRAGDVLVRVAKTANEHRFGAVLVLAGAIVGLIWVSPTEKIQAIADIVTGHNPLMEIRDSDEGRPLTTPSGRTIYVPPEWDAAIRERRKQKESQILQPQVGP